MAKAMDLTGFTSFYHGYRETSALILAVYSQDACIGR